MHYNEYGMLMDPLWRALIHNSEMNIRQLRIFVTHLFPQPIVISLAHSTVVLFAKKK